MTFLYAHPCFAWAALALVSGVVEVALPYFTFVFVAAGALVAAAVAARFSLTPQLIAFSLTTVASLVFVRPLMKPRGGLPSRTDALIGLGGRVTVALAPKGRILVGEEDWAARATRSIEVGRNVRVTGADGIVLEVEEV